MNCSKCGAPLKADAERCDACGEPAPAAGKEEKTEQKPAWKARFAAVLHSPERLLRWGVPAMAVLTALQLLFLFTGKFQLRLYVTDLTGADALSVIELIRASGQKNMFLFAALAGFCALFSVIGVLKLLPQILSKRARSRRRTYLWQILAALFCCGLIPALQKLFLTELRAFEGSPSLKPGAGLIASMALSVLLAIGFIALAVLSFRTYPKETPEEEDEEPEEILRELTYVEEEPDEEFDAGPDEGPANGEPDADLEAYLDQYAEADAIYEERIVPEDPDGAASAEPEEEPETSG